MDERVDKRVYKITKIIYDLRDPTHVVKVKSMEKTKLYNDRSLIGQVGAVCQKLSDGFWLVVLCDLIDPANGYPVKWYIHESDLQK